MWLQYDKAWKHPKRQVLVELYDEWTRDMNSNENPLPSVNDRYNTGESNN